MSDVHKVAIDNIKVAIRVRPKIKRELLKDEKTKWRVENNTIFQIDELGQKTQESYCFDHIFDGDVDNNYIFDCVGKELIDAALKGINSTIFAYGQTSSGKTYTMTGTKKAPGFIPVAVKYMFSCINENPNRKFLLRTSYLEIYNEKLNDLLNKNKDIKLREDLDGNILVNASEKISTTCEEVLSIMSTGEKNRQIGNTNMNERSSRSHTIFRIIIESSEINSTVDADMPVQVSTLNFVDLAGSERASQTKAQGTRLVEGGHINKSLSTLGLVIRQLSDSAEFVNFRDSKLTRILQNSLGGNAKTLIVAAITPVSLENGQSTLAFAQRAKTIKNKPEVNEILTDCALMKQYELKVNNLKKELGQQMSLNKDLETDQAKKDRVITELSERISMLEKAYIVSTGKIKKSHRRHTITGFERLSKSSNLGPIAEGFQILEIESCFESETPLEQFEIDLIEAEKEKQLKSLKFDDSSRPVKAPAITNGVIPRVRLAAVQSKKPCTVTELPEIDDSGDFKENINENIISTPKSVLRTRLKDLEEDYNALRKFTKLESMVKEEETVEGLQEQLRQLNIKHADLQINFNNLKKNRSKNLAYIKAEQVSKEFKEKEFTDNEKDFADKEKEVAEKEKEVAEKEKEVAEKEKEVADKEKEFADKAKEFADKEKEFADKEKKFADKEKEFANKEKDFINKIQKISQSLIDQETAFEQKEANYKRRIDELLALNAELVIGLPEPPEIKPYDDITLPALKQRDLRDEMEGCGETVVLSEGNASLENIEDLECDVDVIANEDEIKGITQGLETLKVILSGQAKTAVKNSPENEQATELTKEPSQELGYVILDTLKLQLEKIFALEIIEDEFMKIAIDKLSVAKLELQNAIMKRDERNTLHDQDVEGKDQESRIKDQETLIKDQETLIKDQETHINDQENTIKEQETRINQQEMKLQDQETQIKYLETQTKDQESQIKDQEVQIIGQESQTKDLRTRIKDQEAQIENQEAQMKTQEAQMKDQEAQMKDLGAQMKGQEIQIKDLRLRILERDALFLGHKSQIKDQGAQIKDQGAQIKDREAQIKDQEAQIKDREAQIKDQEAQIKDQETQIKDQETQIKHLETCIKGQEAQIIDHGPKIKDLGTSIKDQEDQLKNQEAQINDQETQIKQLKMFINVLKSRSLDQEGEREDPVKHERVQINGLETRIKDRGAQVEDQVVQIRNKDAQIKDRDDQIMHKNAQIKDKDVQIKDRDAEIKNKNAQIKDKDAEIKDRDAQIKDRDDQIMHKNAQIKDKDVQIKDRDAEIKNKNAQIKDKDAEIKDRDAQIKDRDDQIMHNNAQIKDKDVQIKDRDAEIKNKNAQIKDREAQIKDRDAQIKDRDAQIKDRDSQIKYKDAKIKVMVVQTEDKDAQIKDKDAQIKDKDAQIKNNNAQIKDKDAQIKDRDDQINNKIDLIKDKDSQIKYKEAQIKVMVVQIEDKDAQIKDKDAHIKDRDDQIKNKNAQIEDKDSQIKNKDAQIKVMVVQIEDKDTQIKDMDAQIKDKDGQIKDRDDQIKNKNALIKDMDAQIKGKVVQIEDKAAQIKAQAEIAQLNKKEIDSWKNKAAKFQVHIFNDKKEAMAERTRLTNKLGELKKEIVAMESTLRNKDNKLKELTNEITALKDTEVMLKEEMTQLKTTRLNEERQERKSRSELEKCCSNCQELTRQLKEKEEANMELDAEVLGAVERIEDQRKELSDLFKENKYLKEKLECTEKERAYKCKPQDMLRKERRKSIQDDNRSTLTERCNKCQELTRQLKEKEEANTQLNAELLGGVDKIEDQRRQLSDLFIENKVLKGKICEYAGKEKTYKCKSQDMLRKERRKSIQDVNRSGLIEPCQKCEALAKENETIKIENTLNLRKIGDLQDKILKMGEEIASSSLSERLPETLEYYKAACKTYEKQIRELKRRKPYDCGICSTKNETVEKEVQVNTVDLAMTGHKVFKEANKDYQALANKYENMKKVAKLRADEIKKLNDKLNTLHGKLNTLSAACTAGCQAR